MMKFFVDQTDLGPVLTIRFEKEDIIHCAGDRTKIKLFGPKLKRLKEEFDKVIKDHGGLGS